jgi:hypothetical protein
MDLPPAQRGIPPALHEILLAAAERLHHVHEKTSMHQFEDIVTGL